MSGNGHSCPRASVRGGVGGGGRALRPCRLCVPISVRLCVPVSLCPCLICAHGSLHPRVPASRGPRASVSPPALHPRSPGSLHLCVLNPCISSAAPHLSVPAAPALYPCSPVTSAPPRPCIPVSCASLHSWVPVPLCPHQLCSPGSLHLFVLNPCTPCIPGSLPALCPCSPSFGFLHPCHLCTSMSLHPWVPSSPVSLHLCSPGSLHLCVLNPCALQLHVPASLGLCSPGSFCPYQLCIPAPPHPSIPAVGLCAMAASPCKER